jgi:hypothetical protein
MNPVEVPFGSKADIGQPIRDVRFAPESGHAHALPGVFGEIRIGLVLAQGGRRKRQIAGERQCDNVCRDSLGIDIFALHFSLDGQVALP